MCTEIVKYYFIVPLKGGHSSYKATVIKGMALALSLAVLFTSF
jgi:hypothetical protein